jgi:kinesin family protein 6/9
MEIYNETAYDLLDKKHLELPIEQWNKVKSLIFSNPR